MNGTSAPVFIARCPEHGLHGERTHCYECGVEAEQVAMVPAAERDGLREALRKLDVELHQQGVINERVGRHIIDQALGTRGQAPSVTSGAR